MSDAKDLRGFKFRVRLKHGDVEVEMETGRTASYPDLETLAGMARKELLALAKDVDGYLEPD